MEKKYSEIVCEGCGYKLKTGEHPALSRYGHGSLCSKCGVREAFQKDFIGADKKAGLK